jgi:uncharacterized membrane protein
MTGVVFGWLGLYIAMPALLLLVLALLLLLAMEAQL